jgi:hypothetical protein
MPTLRTLLALLIATGALGMIAAAPQTEPPVTPTPGFAGKIGTTLDDSTPALLPVVRAPEGSPNVIYILFDDVGFSDLQPYGSEIATPAIDSLAQSGLRYTNFHTAAICRIRAALLTSGPHSRHEGSHRPRPRLLNGAADPANGRHDCADPRQSRLQHRRWAVARTPEADTGENSPRIDWPPGKGLTTSRVPRRADHQFHPTLIQDNHAIDPESCRVSLLRRPRYLRRCATVAKPIHPAVLHASQVQHRPHPHPCAAAWESISRRMRRLGRARRRVSTADRDGHRACGDDAAAPQPRRPGRDALSADEMSTPPHGGSAHRARRRAGRAAGRAIEGTGVRRHADARVRQRRTAGVGPQGAFTYPHGDVGRLSMLARSDDPAPSARCRSTSASGRCRR